MVTEPVFKQLIHNSIHNFYFIFPLYLISKIYLLAPYCSKVAVFYSFSPPHLDVFVSIIWCVCGNGIYTEYVTLNTKHLNVPLNKALAIWPVNVKWKKQLGKNAVSHGASTPSWGMWSEMFTHVQGLIKMLAHLRKKEMYYDKCLWCRPNCPNYSKEGVQPGVMERTYL